MNSNNEPVNDILDDVYVSLSSFSKPTLTSALMIRNRLDEERAKGFDQREFVKKHKRPRNLDIGCGVHKEKDWIGLDHDSSCKPDLLMDAHAMMLSDCCIDDARMVKSLSYMADPEQVLREVWRVLVPQGRLIIVEGSPGSDESSLPKVRFEFTRRFWENVTAECSHAFVPPNANGRWELDEHEYDFNQIGERLSFKLKLTRQQVADTFRNVSDKQTIILRKVVF